MTFTQLRALLAVADTGSVRAAAERLVVSQPAVSGALAALERELGFALVERAGRGLRVTAAGQHFAAAARDALGSLDQGRRHAAALAAPEQAEVRLAAVATAVEYLLLPQIATFRAAHPQVGVELTVGNRFDVWRALAAREVDLVVAGRPPATMEGRILARADNSLVVVGPAGDPPPDDQAVGRALAERTWLLREEGSGTRAATAELLADLGLSPPTMLLGSPGAVSQAAVAGLGVTLSSQTAVAPELAAGQLVIWPCPGTPLARPWHLVAHRRSPISPTMALMTATLCANGFVPTAEGRRVLR